MKSVNFVLILIFLFLPLTAWSSTTVSEVEKNLMCTCGCTMALYTCECGTAAKMRNQIQAMIDKGMDKDKIIATYVNQYGERILSAPTKSGFNLLAWVLPFVVLIVVGFFLYKALRRWSIDSEHDDEEKLQTEVEAQYNKKLKEELDKFEEGEGE